jgi:hypothetical protein
VYNLSFKLKQIRGSCLQFFQSAAMYLLILSQTSNLVYVQYSPSYVYRIKYVACEEVHMYILKELRRKDDISST